MQLSLSMLIMKAQMKKSPHTGRFSEIMKFCS